MLGAVVDFPDKPDLLSVNLWLNLRGMPAALAMRIAGSGPFSAVSLPRKAR